MIPAFVSMPGVRARPSFRLQCLKKTVDRRGRRVAGRDYESVCSSSALTYELMKDAPQDYFGLTRGKMPGSWASMTGHPVTARAFYGRQEVLESAAVEGVVILEFPTFEEAKACTRAR
jgi:hypothetical protein